MYKEHFGLQDEPFRMTPDTRYLFKSHRYEEALASLIYGIREKKGFIVITGEIGTGKTTLCRSLLNQLGAETKTAVILNPSLNKVELLHAIIDDLNIEIKSKNPSQKALLDTLNIFLIEQARAGTCVAAIIDEAQNLDTEVLESIRMLSNLETEQEKLLQIILVGQPELNEVLKMPKMEQLRQRIAVRYHITPLERNEILSYIKHRLAVAGNENCVEFQPSAIEAISKYTKGTPRLINVICDKCMLAAYACRTKTIDGELAMKAIADHEGPSSEYAVRTMPLAEEYAAPDERGRKRPDWKPAVVAALIALAVIGIGVGTRHSAPPPAPQAAAVQEPPKEVVTIVPPREEVRAAAPAESASVLHESLRLWGAEAGESTARLEDAGMIGVNLVTTLSFVSRIGLPALIEDASGRRLLVEASPTHYGFYDPKLDAAAYPARIFKMSRLAENEAVLVNAVIPLPAHWSVPAIPNADPRLPQLLSAALHRQGAVRTDPATIMIFQRSVGIPADGIIGPLTWCALVARANADYPRLQR